MTKKAEYKIFIEKYFGSWDGAITIIGACLGYGFAFGKYYEKFVLYAENKRF